MSGLLALTSLRAFLSSAKSSLQKAIASKEPVNLVIGNESADLDSISSSILFAYFRSLSPTASGFPRLHVPLINIPSSDIRIRPELLTLLRHVNLEPDHLITLDDLPPTDKLSSQLTPEKTRWCLVDHNALQGSLGDIYSARVAGCIDHHKEENKVPYEISDQPRIIKTAGSCTSLIVNHFRDVWQDLSQSASQSVPAQPQGDAVVGTDDIALRRAWDAQLAVFGIASILVDTHNLEAVDKVTPEDEGAAEFLEAKILSASAPYSQFDRHAFFDEISEAKQDSEGLSLQDVLRKDYKQWDESNARLGISSVPEQLLNLLSRCDGDQGFREELKKFTEARNLSLYALMTKFSSASGEFQKELLLHAVESSAQDTLKKFAENSAEELGLEDWNNSSLDSGPDIKVYLQRNVDKSRKQVAPLLREALKL